MDEYTISSFQLNVQETIPGSFLNSGWASGRLSGTQDQVPQMSAGVYRLKLSQHIQHRHGILETQSHGGTAMSSNVNQYEAIWKRIEGIRIAMLTTID